MDFFIFLSGVVFGIFGYYLYVKITEKYSSQKPSGFPGGGGTPKDTPNQQ